MDIFLSAKELDIEIVDLCSLDPELDSGLYLDIELVNSHNVYLHMSDNYNNKLC